MKGIYHYRKWFLPGFMLTAILLTLIPGQEGWLGFDIAILPMLLGGGFITYNALIAIIETKRITAGTLVVLALIGSAYVGEYRAGAIVALMMIGGEFLESITLDKTRNAVKKLMSLVPETALVERNGEWQEVSVSEVLAGERLMIKPGANIPVDGTIEIGNAVIDESALTGEPMPVDKATGDKVFAGTCNQIGSLEIIAEKVGEDSTLGRIIQIIYEAQNKKGNTQRVADRFAQYFTPVILTICVIVWLSTNDLMRVMSVLVVACPCALVLATPTAVVAAIGNAAKRGVLIKGGAVLELAAKVKTIIFDKTGTITQGKPQFYDVFGLNEHSSEKVLDLAASVEFRSEHPIAKAIVEGAKDRKISFNPSQSFEQIPGIGVRDGNLWVGNERLLDMISQDEQLQAQSFIESNSRKGYKVIFVVKDNVLIGGMALRDTIRQETSGVINELRNIGIQRILMLTGDNHQSANEIASRAGITEFQAKLLPEDKLNQVDQIRSSGSYVAMVGDGINDAPALMRADVGIAMATAGTDIAIESADIALMGDDLANIPYLFDLSRHTLNIIKQNIWFFAVGVNIIGIALASSGWLSPIYSAILHNISSLFVVLNSARILTFRGKAAPNRAFYTQPQMDTD